MKRERNMVRHRCSEAVLLACLLAPIVATAEPPPESASRIRYENGSIESMDLAPPQRATGDPGSALFERLPPRRTGIDFVHRWVPPEKHGYDLETVLSGGGVTLGDYDGDGLVDLYLTRPYGGNRLYRNLGGLRFEDVTARTGVGNKGAWNTGASFVDVDGDGDLDLYVCVADYESETGNRLYVNQGGGKFEELAQELGLGFSGISLMAAFADYDLDGDMDAYLLTNRTAKDVIVKPDAISLRNGRNEISEELREIGDVLYVSDDRYVLIPAGQYDRLYRNDGSPGRPRFTDVSEDAGIQGNDIGLSATWWDYDSDRLPDLYVANDFYGPDRLYHNEGDGTFTDVAKTALPHTPWFSMGTDFGDLDNDGRLDFMASDMSGTDHYQQKMSMGDMGKSGWFLTLPEPRQYMRNAVYLNTGTERFMEAAHMTGLANSDWTWSVKFADLDNDGNVDVFITNGMTRDWGNSDLDARVERMGGKFAPAGRRFWLEQPTLSQRNLAFRNLGGLAFESVAEAWGVEHVGVSYGAGLADLDDDGDLDLVVNSLNEPVAVYQNRSRDRRGVVIRLQGTLSNQFGVGATVRASAGGRTHVRYSSLARGFMSTNDPRVHLGLGGEETIDELLVTWPSGHTQRFENLAAGRRYIITEPAGPVPERRVSEAAPPMFARSKAVRTRHREKSYDDFARQPLLPSQLSRLGPGLASSDVDGDGDEDLYVGGAAGQPGTLLINDGAGGFRSHRYPHRISEDMGVLFFDSEGDGDMDLYVVSGGVEWDPGHEALRDRLYVNDGQGGFSEAPSGVLPEEHDSGSSVAAADFDRDGDLDLFVGGRLIPGAYPLAPGSRLLRNDGGRFRDVTGSVAPRLRESGMVTGAIWTDADRDGWLDLMVAVEWGPVRFYRNQHGTLVERTEDAGLGGLLGWWNGIAAADVDRDGDVDYVVTNLGLNTKYHASPERPALLYYGDVDGSGERHLVEAEFENDLAYPVRGKSCSTAAMPSLASRLPTFHEFAIASLEDIYQPRRLRESLRFEATTLESGILINDGGARFSFTPLPRLAQIAPGFGVVLTEIDGDGNADLYVAQNSYSPQPETGRMDGGVSLLLTGNGDGSFEPVAPHRSGLVVPFDAKGSAATDLNGDGWVDLLVAVNDGELHAFENQQRSGARMGTVRLIGEAGNPTAVGARVTVHFDDSSLQTAEVYAGSGYLSQSSPAASLSFGLGSARGYERVDVRWPNGSDCSYEAVRPDTITVQQASCPSDPGGSRPGVE